MARINWDDKIEADYRFKRLVRIVGNEREAKGMLLDFWRIAQRFWGQESLVPLDEFNAEGFEPILNSGLAEVREGGVYAKGAADEFDWYLQRCKASKKGVAARHSRSTGTDAPVNRKGVSGQPELMPRSTESSDPVNPLTLTPSITPSINLISESDEKKPPNEVQEKTPIRKLAEMWNELSGPNTVKVVLSTFKSSQPRWASAKSRLEEFPDLEYWRKVILRVAASKHCQGENNWKWRADFEFLVRQESHIKVLEGKYDNIEQKSLTLKSPEQAAAESLQIKLRYVNCSWCNRTGTYTDVNDLKGICGACEAAKIRGIENTLPVHPATLPYDEERDGA